MNFHFFSSCSRVFLAASLLCITACSDSRKLDLEIKELKTTEVELITESNAISAQVTDSHRKLVEVERSLRGDDKDVAEAQHKVDQLKGRLSYLQSAIKAANEQSDALNAETTKYKIKYLSK